MFNTNDWFVFDAGTVNKKVCNKIKRWASNKWKPSTVDIKETTTEEERQVRRVIINQILNKE